MISGGAWNTRPFRPETLVAAREAARRSGLSLAEWLNSAILDTAADAGVRAGRRGFGADDLGPMEDDALAVIGERLDQLARRIDRLTTRGDEPDARRPHATPSGSAPEIRSSLHTIEARLASMVREFVPQSAAATERLADVVRELSSRLDRLATMAPPPGDIPTHDPAARQAPDELDEDRAKSGDRTAGLSGALAEISARQRELDAEMAGAQDFSRLEQQLHHITEQIETLRRPADTDEAAAARDVDRAALERIETRILELARKLDASDARLEGLGTIERKVIEFAHKLDTADARLEGLEAIEHSLADLTFQLKEIRAAAVEEAERTAKTVAGEMLAGSSATGTEIDSLKQDLTEFRVSQAEVDHRTEDVLDALQGTLERLVDRLATIETGIRAEARTSTESQEPRGLSASSRSGSGSAPPSVRPIAPKLAPEQRPTDPDLPADHPLEPGSGAPHGRAPSSAATRVAAPEPAVAGPASAEPAAKANFIAAARRAAQAAAAESADPTEPVGRSQAAGGIAAAVGNRRRPLMIAAGMLAFGAGGLHMAVNGQLPSLPEINDLVRIEAPRPASEEPHAPTGKAKLTPAPAPDEARTTLGPEPIVPESGSAPPRRPSSAPGEAFLLSPVPNGSVAPAAATQVRENVPSAAAPPSATRTSDVTGSLPVAQVTAATIASQHAVPEPAEKLPAAIGNAALRSAAAAGNPAAEYEIGMRFSEGRGVAQSFEEAAQWLARAADHGLAPAQYRLGSLYEKGQGVNKDLAEARRLYLAAAQQGNAKAMHNLAVLYAVGLEGGPDYKTASEWFQKAADHGVADSQYNLGILFARGVGVEQNLAEAFKWFALAAQQGDKDAAKKRDEVAARLDPQAVVAARLAVQTWTADPQPDKATKVEPPGGDWDRAPPAGASSKSKAGRKGGTSGST